MATSDRGFASMTKKKQREIAKMGGRAAHAKGVAHQWTTEEAREAGRKGGNQQYANKLRRQQETSPPAKQTDSETTTS